MPIVKVGGNKKRVELKERDSVSELEVFVKKHLSNIIRKHTGESYAEHSIKMTATLKELTDDPTLLRGSMAHDVLMHPNGKNLLKEIDLSKREAKIVQKMHQLRRLHIDENVQDLGFVVRSFTNDKDIIILRLAHRLCDIRNIGKFKGDIKKSLARETIFAYGPIAGRLGFNAWRREMEDVSFAVLHPRYAKQLKDQFEAYRKFDLTCLRQTKKFVEKNLEKAGIKAEVHYRIKGVYSTYKKLLSSKYTFRTMPDRLAVRILVNTIDDCYRTLGIIHKIMRPMAKGVKDYIGAPKDNGYRSIHTVVYPLPHITEQQIEVQIRTLEMHQDCEFGLAAHYKYKHLNYALADHLSPVDILRNFETLRIETKSPQRFKEVLQNHLAGNKLIIFDQDNNIYHIGRPATVLDFVCLTQKKRCSKLKEVYVNGRPQPFAYTLHDGDTVRLSFAKHKTLKKDWLNFCQKKVNKEFLKSLLH